MGTSAAIRHPILVKHRMVYRADQPTDDVIAAFLARGDDRAIDALWRRYGRTVFAYLLSTLRDHAEAEDVHQQVFLEAWRRRRQYDAERSGLFTWLMTIARSRAIDSMRKRVPEPRSEGPGEQGGGQDVEEEVVERWRIAQLLRRIPADEAELLRMRFYEDLTQREISERTGLPLGTVKMRMVQALGRLRDLVDREEER